MSRDDRTLLDQINELRRDVDGLRASVALLTGAMRSMREHWIRAAETGAPRETGDSLSGGGRREIAKLAEADGLVHPDPPVLNKSGGSDVDGGDANCVHDWRPYFAHLVCVKCGAAQRGAAGGR